MKDIFLIKGLGGKKGLKGALPVYGAKNAALPALASALLFRDAVSFENVPDILDVRQAVSLMEALGASVERLGRREFLIDASEAAETTLDGTIAKHMRASIVFAGPILARRGEVSFPHPGGCVLGERPVDMFLEAFQKMGAVVTREGERYAVTAREGRLLGAEIFLRVPSHTVTETILLAATLAEGHTVIKNAAMDPEIVNVADFLNSCGAKIRGVGSPTIEIEGGKLLSAAGKICRIIPDRIEAGSFLILAALAGEDITVENCEPLHLESVTNALMRMGVPLQISKNSVRVKNPTGGKTSDFRGIHLKTREYPGFPTDLQAPLAVLMTQVSGESQIFETIFEGRLGYGSDLSRMGAAASVWSPHTMTVKGPTPLRGRELDGPDIRAGLAYVLAAIVAKGRSVINNVHYIDRGYERIEERLRAIGVEIERVSN